MICAFSRMLDLLNFLIQPNTVCIVRVVVSRVDSDSVTLLSQI